MPDPDLLSLLADADRRLVRAVDAMDADAWALPSLLPGWTRSHVIAHLALNAEALVGVVEGVLARQPVAMYASQEARDRDITELSAGSRPDLRDRLYASLTAVGDAIAALPDDLGGAEVARVPGGGTFPASAVGGMRMREVEIHHADLDVGYTAADWPLAVAVRVLDFRSTAAVGSAFTARATDVDREWAFGDGDGPTVSGPVRALAWWTTGRGDGDGLTSSDDRVPRLESW